MIQDFFLLLTKRKNRGTNTVGEQESQRRNTWVAVERDVSVGRRGKRPLS